MSSSPSGPNGSSEYTTSVSSGAWAGGSLVTGGESEWKHPTANPTNTTHAVRRIGSPPSLATNVWRRLDGRAVGVEPAAAAGGHGPVGWGADRGGRAGPPL